MKRFLLFFMGIIIFSELFAVGNNKNNDKEDKTSTFHEVCKKYEIKKLVDDKRKKNIEKEFKKLDYSFTDPFIVINPYKRAPLSALVKFYTDEKVRLTFQIIKPDGEKEFILRSSKYTKNHEYILKFLFANKENNIIMISEDKSNNKKENIIKVKTNKLEKAIPIIIEKISKNENYNYKYLLSFIESSLYPYKSAIIDTKANYRWVLYPLKVSHTILKNNENFFVSHMGTNCFININYLGQINKVYYMGDYFFHHDFSYINNNLAILVTKKNLNSVQDHLIEYDFKNEKIIKIWDLRNYFIIDPSIKRKNVFWEEPVNDWLHANSIYYDKNDNSFIISARYQGIFKINYNGRFQWHIGKKIKNLKKEYRSKNLQIVRNTKIIYELKDFNHNLKDIQFVWPEGQHSAMMISRDKLFYFNNNGGNPINLKKVVSTGIMYHIDEENNNVLIVDEYGREEEIFSYFISSIDYNYLNKNKLLLYGNVESVYKTKIAKLIEYNGNNEKIMELDLIGDNIFSAKYFIK